MFMSVYFNEGGISVWTCIAPSASTSCNQIIIETLPEHILNSTMSKNTPKPYLDVETELRFIIVARHDEGGTDCSVVWTERLVPPPDTFWCHQHRQDLDLGVQYRQGGDVHICSPRRNNPSL